MADHDTHDHTGVTGVPSASAPNPTTIELGHASDTTLSRVSAGVVAVEGTNLVKAGAVTSSGLTQATARLLGRTTASTGAVEEITVGTGLSLSAGSLTATGGAGGITRTTQGTTSAGGSWQGARGLYMKKLTLATAGEVASIVGHVKGDGSNVAGLGAAIFADNSGTPSNVIAIGGSGGILTDLSAYAGNLKLSTTGRDVRVPMGTWLPAADYWFAIGLFAGADNIIHLAYTGSGSDRTLAPGSGGFIWVDHSVVASSAGTNDHTIYINVLR